MWKTLKQVADQHPSPRDRVSVSRGLDKAGSRRP